MVLLDVEEDLARDERASGGFWVIVENNWRRLKLPVERGGRVGVHIFAGAAEVHAREGYPMVVMVVLFFVVMVVVVVILGVSDLFARVSARR